MRNKSPKQFTADPLLIVAGAVFLIGIIFWSVDALSEDPSLYPGVDLMEEWKDTEHFWSPLFSPPARRSTCHPDLLALAQCVHKDIAIRIFSCYRTPAEQKKLFDLGRSKLDGSPGRRSKHNQNPSLAMDMVPLEFDSGIIWNDWEGLVAMAFFAQECADGFGWPEDYLTIGFYWQSISDPYHFELEEE